MALRVGGYATWSNDLFDLRRKIRKARDSIESTPNTPKWVAQRASAFSSSSDFLAAIIAYAIDELEVIERTKSSLQVLGFIIVRWENTESLLLPAGSRE
jgi:hypothetical protein